MKRQNQIKRTLTQPENLDYLCELIKTGKYSTRKSLIAVVCEHFGFFDPRGQAQHGGCIKALRNLEAAGHFVLPEAKFKPQKPSPRRLNSPVPDPLDVPNVVDKISGLKLVLVGSPEQMCTWNEIMITEHPLGPGPLVGRQLRYLVESDHGLLGGLGFSAAALHLEDRDTWIGWDYEQRNNYLQYVVGLNRFLIRPSVSCANLASKVLSLSLKFMAQDFEQKYKYRPLLVESFVESGTGTCFRAANWIHVGRTKGRGRQDRHKESALSVKDIYMSALENDFREQIGVAPKIVPGPLEPAEGLDADVWAHNEFGDASLGDVRLSKRLVLSAKALSEKPGYSYSNVAKGDWAATKAYYRLIDHPDSDAVNMEKILAPHRERTVLRMQSQTDVLCLTDRTDLNFNSLAQCEGLGVIGTNQTGAQTRGLEMCSTFAVCSDGLPLGVLKSICEAPEEKSPEDKRPAKKIPIEEKKSFDWIEHYRDLVTLKVRLPDTRLIHVCDREADFFDLFYEQQQNPGAELLVRAKHDRNVADSPGKLFAAVARTEVLGQVDITVPRQSERPKMSRKKARAKRDERKAIMDLRAMPTQLRSSSCNNDKQPVDIWIVHARESSPPSNETAVEWFLLTTIETTSFEQAGECLQWYRKRWRIEDWHRVLKSGCRIENLGHEKAERLCRAISINIVIAWRIMVMTLLGREVPNLPAEILFSDTELRVLSAFAKKKKLNQPDHVGDAVRLVAHLGGYLGRKNDPPPGHQIIWHGYQTLQAMCFGVELLDDW
jgi:hypothetical protein